jgi:hypothetical protein
MAAVVSMPAVLVVTAARSRVLVRDAAFAMVHLGHAVVVSVPAVLVVMDAAAPLPVRAVLGLNAADLADILRLLRFLEHERVAVRFRWLRGLVVRSFRAGVAAVLVVLALVVLAVVHSAAVLALFVLLVVVLSVFPLHGNLH